MGTTPFPTEFPAAYRQAVVEMRWSAEHPVNEELALMVHTAGGVDADAVDVEPGEYDVMAFVDNERAGSVAVRQSYEIAVTFFDGVAPEGHTAFGDE